METVQMQQSQNFHPTKSSNSGLLIEFKDVTSLLQTLVNLNPECYKIIPQTIDCANTLNWLYFQNNELLIQAMIKLKMPAKNAQ